MSWRPTAKAIVQRLSGTARRGRPDSYVVVWAIVVRLEHAACTRWVVRHSVELCAALLAGPELPVPIPPAEVRENGAPDDKAGDHRSADDREQVGSHGHLTCLLDGPALAGQLERPR